MIVVTGGAGFVGSNLVHALCVRGERVVVVDDLTDGKKFVNLVGAPIEDYVDRERFRALVGSCDPTLAEATAIFHQGACTSTTEWDGRYMMENNFEYSKLLLTYCQRRSIPLIYASSAAVYGAGKGFVEERAFEAPLNVYGYSKLLFDEVVRRLPRDGPQVVGLRYFNVYGPREAHKESMASVAFHFSRQLSDRGTVRLFRGSDGYADGEQRRDFVHVDDVVAVNLWFLDHSPVSGVFNVGTGRSQTFNDVANAVLAFFGRGAIDYVPFPKSLEGHYQSFTEANLDRLRGAGCEVHFRSVEQGVGEYMRWLYPREGTRMKESR